MIGKLKFLIAIITCIMVVMDFVCPFVYAQSEVEGLIDLLISKGVLSRGEAVQIMEEANNTAKMQMINAVEEGPKWLANTTFKGDLRIRHQYENREDDSSEPEHRFRTRLRYGLTNTINDKLTVGFRLATGSNRNDGRDPRSTNQTWGDVFSNWEFNVDEAYFDWHPYDYFKLIGGKREVKKLMLRNSDLIWDSDLTFDGATAYLTTGPMRSGLELFTWIGAYVLQMQTHDRWETNIGVTEDNQGNDPWMLHVQPGLIYTNKGDGHQWQGKMGLSYLGIRNIDDQQNAVTLNSSGITTGNSFNSTDTLRYSYDVFYPTFSLEYAWGGPKGKTYAVKTFYDYIYNPDAEDTGFLLGAKIGYKKVGQKFGDWQLGYNYRYLEDDAFLSGFSDSDAYSGNTNVKGNEFSLQVGLAKNVILGFDYYFMEPISGAANAGNRQRRTENLFQTDLVFKF